MRVERNCEREAVRGDLLRRRVVDEDAVALPRAVGLKDFVHVFRRQPALGVLARHLAHRIDEQDPPLRLRRLARAAYHDTGLHRRIVEEIRREADHRFDEVFLDQRLADVLLLIAKQHSVRQQNRAAARLRVHRLEDVLDEGVVGAALRRRAEDVALIGIVRE